MIYEYLVGSHGRVQAAVCFQLTDFNEKVANNSFGVAMVVTLDLGSADARATDAAMEPHGLPRRPVGQGMTAHDDSYPTFVVEAAAAETVSSLHNLAPTFFNARTTIQVYLAVKVWEQRDDGTFAALALLYLRSSRTPISPVQAISFGTGPIHANALSSMPQAIMSTPISGVIDGFGGQLCNQANLEAFQISIPVADLYHGVPGGVPVGLPSNLLIDLYKVQRVAY